MKNNSSVAVLNSLSSILIALTSLLVIAVFSALAQYAYPSADDFCMASGVRDEGLLAHLWQHYFEWSGRYTGNALYAVYPLVFGLFEGYPWMPLLLISVLFTASAFLLSRLFQLPVSATPVWLTSLAFSGFYLLGLRHTASSLYWMAGAMTYQSANILLLFTLGLMIQIFDRYRANRRYSRHILMLLLLIVAGIGTNEINMVVMSCLFGLTFLLFIRTERKFSRSWLLLLAVTAICVAIVYFSPGNTVRESTFEYRHDWSRSINGSLKMGAWTLVVWTGTPLFMVTSLLLPFAAAWLYVSSWRSFRPGSTALMLLVAITFGMPFVLQFPAWWAMGGWPPPRSVDAIYFVFVCSWFFLLGAVTIRLGLHGLIFDQHRRIKPGASLTLLLLTVLFCAAVLVNGKFQRAWHDLWHRAPAFQDYMQQRHALIEQSIDSRQYYLQVPAHDQEVPKSIYFNDIRPDWRDWRNLCYAGYFGLQGIARDRPQKTTGKQPLDAKD